MDRAESVKLRFLIGASAVALLVVLLTYSELSSTSRLVATEEAQSDANEMLTLASSLMAEAVAVEDRIQIHVFAHALLDNGVESISVLNERNESLFESESRSKPSDEEALEASARLTFDGRQVGSIRLGFDREGLESRLRGAHSWVYSVFATGFFLLLGLGFFILRAPFRTLRRLTEEAEHIGRGDLKRRVPVRGKDELARFCEAFNCMVGGLQASRQEVFDQQLQAIQAMVSAVEAKDAYTRGHCLRVRDNVTKILEHLGGVDPETQQQIEIAAVLHDVGKIGVPDNVLLKTGALTDEEFATVQLHSEIGETILSQLESLREVAVWVRHHHERWDGNGYPDRIAGTDIPFASRVIAVADTIDAMTTERPYKSALNLYEAVELIREERGKHFDPEIADAALEAFACEPESICNA